MFLPAYIVTFSVKTYTVVCSVSCFFINDCDGATLREALFLCSNHPHPGRDD